MDGLLIKNVNDILFAIDAFFISDFRTLSKVRCPMT